jgi:hypothetical protein
VGPAGEFSSILLRWDRTNLKVDTNRKAESERSDAMKQSQTVTVV